MAERSGDPTTVLKQARLLQEQDFKEFCTKVTKNLRSRERGSECVNNLRRLFLLLAATRQRRSLSTELINELKKVACEPQQGPKRLRLLCATILREVIPTSQLIIDNVEPPIEEKWIPVIFPLVWVQEVMIKLMKRAGEHFVTLTETVIHLITCICGHCTDLAATCALAPLHGKERGYWSKHVPQLIQWLSNPGIPVELQLMSLGSLKLLIYVDDSFTSQDDVGKVSSVMANWLKNASTFSAPNPYQRQLLRGGKTRGHQLVEEVDGTSSRYFFTVLSIAHYCFPDQFLNIHSFSMLRPWLQQPAFKTQIIVPSGSPRSPHSPMVPVTVSNSGSIENISESPHLSASAFPSTLSQSQSTLDNVSVGSHSSAGYVSPISQSSPLEPGIQSTSESPIVGQFSESADRDSISSDGGSRPQTPLSFLLDPEEMATKSLTNFAAKRMKHKRSHSNLSFSKLFPPSGQGVKNGQQELKERACEYCLRLLEQSERKPGKQQDAILIEACLVEAIYILDTLCSSDKSLIPKLIEIIRRLYARVASDINKWKRVLIPVVQFLLNHGETVVFDPEPACKTLFGPVLSSYYSHSSLAFDIIFFSLENLEKLCYSTGVLSKYFPNILKILAWYPRTYLKEFMDLLPAMLNQDTVVEMFHALLDLPCLAAALCTFPVKANSGDKMTFGQQSSAEAFLSSENRSLYSFILRAEAGQGDTIDKLATLHSLLEDTLQQPRVVVSAQIVPVLLNVMFATVLEQAEEETVSRLVPVILERVGLLYPVQHYRGEIHELLSQRLVQLCQKYPNLIIRFQQDIMDFVTGLKNLGPTKENFFVHLVWIIGEFASPAHDSGCTVQNIVHYFEAFEALTYEVIMQTPPGKVSFSGRLISVLMTTLAKLASRCQDLIQRAILCLSKVVRQKPVLLSDPECYPDVLMRAQELINLLKLPNVAPVILSPDVEVYSGRWHRDSNSSLPLLLRTCDTILAS